MQKDNQKVDFDPFLGFVFLHSLHLSLVHGNPLQVLISSSLFNEKFKGSENFPENSKGSEKFPS